MKLELKKPIRLEITHDNGMWTVYCEELNIHSMSDISCSHAVDQFFEVMKICYEDYVQNDPSKLTKDALELREKLKEYFKVE